MRVRIPMVAMKRKKKRARLSKPTFLLNTFHDTIIYVIYFRVNPFALSLCDVSCTLHKMCKLSDAISETENYNLSSELKLPLCDYVDVEQLEGLRPHKSDLSVLQLNIRGLLNKQGRLKRLNDKMQH